MNRKHITLGSLLICLLSNSCPFFFKPSFIPPLDDTTKEPSKDFHSVPGSQDVHTQRHFQQHLSFLEMSFTSTTGLQELQQQ